MGTGNQISVGTYVFDLQVQVDCGGGMSGGSETFGVLVRACGYRTFKNTCKGSCSKEEHDLIGYDGDKCPLCNANLDVETLNDIIEDIQDELQELRIATE